MQGFLELKNYLYLFPILTALKQSNFGQASFSGSGIMMHFSYVAPVCRQPLRHYLGDPVFKNRSKFLHVLEKPTLRFEREKF